MNHVSIHALAAACGTLVMTPCAALAQSHQTTLPPSAAGSAQGTTGASTADSARAAEASTPLTTQVAEVVVTAQKRLENVQNVGMSIQAASGDALVKLGVTDTKDLVKIVPGLSFNGGFGGVPVFSIRGVGYLDVSLASSPTVSINEDEVPLPFSVEAAGSTLDLQRVEVLKGPQGTLFGENATGGAINYIAGKPTDHFEAGFDASYGRFNTLDVEGYVSGPITDTLDFRAALRTIQADGWQVSQTRGDTLGSRDFTTGRFSLRWKPTERLRVLGTLSGFHDNSESQAPQFYGFRQFNSGALPPGFTSHPIAPNNDRAADWDTCINASTVLISPADRPNLPIRNSCENYKANNSFYKGALRIDYDLGRDLTITSLTSYQEFNYHHPFEGDGTPYTDYANIQRGHLNAVYQELRLSGRFGGRGNWIAGGNYEHDGALEFDTQKFDQSSIVVPPIIPGFPAIFPGDSNLYQSEHRDSYAGFAHGEYPITQSLTFTGGVRYTQTNISDVGAELDTGNGVTSLLTYELQILNRILNGTSLTNPPLVVVPPGGAVSLGPAPNFIPGYFHGQLNENNVSWRAGLDWKIAPRILVYGNISQGYKAGSFPQLAATFQSQYSPVTQEGLLAYEVGFKSELFDRTLQLNGAAFYYDYNNKQITGDTKDPVFGPLPRLVNVPQSHVVGFELSAKWQPIEGVTITPAVSYSKNRIDGCAGEVGAGLPGCHLGNFYAYDYQPVLVNITGERYPGISEVQADIDAQYQWKLRDDLSAFVGANISYQGPNNSGFGEPTVYNVDGYALVDLRAGLERGNWRFQIWGRNVLDQFYVNNKVAVVDAFVRYTGMPVTYGVTLSARFK